MLKKLSQNNKLFIIERTIIYCLLAALLILHLLSCYYYYESKKNIAAKESIKIGIFLKEYFDSINRINVITGKQITQNFDYDFIAKTLRLITKNDNDDLILTWTYLDWTNTQDKIAINSVKGILKEENQIDISKRKYIPNSRQHPWVLSLAKPTFGVISNLWIIPAKTGIVDKNGKYLGSITLGIKVKNLVDTIKSKISSDVDFLIIDSDYNLILQSASDEIMRDDYRALFSKLDIKNDNGFLKKNFEFKGVVYSHYSTIDSYPYIILTGFDKKRFYKDMFVESLPSLLQLIFILALIIVFAKIKIRK